LPKAIELSKAASGLLAGAVLLIIVVWAASTYFPIDVDHAATGTSASTSTPYPARGVSSILGNEPQTATPENWLTDSPTIVGNSSTIDYPPDYVVLTNFTLGLINADRAAAGLGPVALSGVPSGQQHADSMAYYGYFSHWDDQGYKPYMRYTLLGGLGSVNENLALDYCSAPSPDSAQPVTAPCYVQTVENAINASERGMMNNDLACCNDGHRGNILGALHNSVSIGIAYNSTTVYLVEDFEDSYIFSGSLQLSAGVVSFNGRMSQADPGWMKSTLGAEVTIYYDPLPSNISLGALAQSPSCAQFSELNESAPCQYQGAYSPGTEISTVFAPCPPGQVCSAGSAGNYTYAQTWVRNGANFSIVFSINGLVSSHGSGVYTFYLWPEGRAPEPITSLSVFVTGQ
jgi:uncharacterized protein YkwD